MDKVTISGLKTEAVIGVYDWEREIRQPLYIDVVMATDIRQAAKTDDLQFTLNYKAITDAIKSYVAQSRFQLIEALAESLAQKIRTDYDVSWVQLTVHKPGAIADADDVSISIERGVRP